jgi:hypothetical protein
VSILYRLLLVLLTLRLLMPPGICVCKWNAPAARLLAEVLHTHHEDLPSPADDDDDHAPGCPASPLACGMGVKPASPSPPIPEPSLEPMALPEAILIAFAPRATPVESRAGPPDHLYLTLLTLRI